MKTMTLLERIERLEALAGLEPVAPDLVDMRRTSPAKVSADAVICATAEEYGVAPNVITGKSHRQAAVRPRHVAMYICRDLAKLSYGDIGDAFGGKNHATVMHACKKVRYMLRREMETRAHVAAIVKGVSRGAV